MSRDTIALRKMDESFVSIDCTDAVAMELSDYFSYENEGARWHRAYRSGSWDGRTRLFKPKNPVLWAGLVPLLKRWCNRENVKLEAVDTSQLSSLRYRSLTVGQFNAAYSGLKITDAKGIITPYDYQLRAVYEGLRRRRMIAISPTASGKSLIAYLLVRGLQALEVDSKILIVVPRVTLVDQFKKEMGHYSRLDKWDAEENVHAVRDGVKETSAPVTITTWQSVFRMPLEYFKNFTAAIMDEAHTCEASSLTTILESLISCTTRFGMTGTLKDSKVHRLVLTGLIGPPVRMTTTRKLIDEGRASKLAVRLMMLKHSEADAFRLYQDRADKRTAYQKEMKYLRGHKRRNDLLVNLASTRKGNTLVLFDNNAYGRDLYEKMRVKVKDCYFVIGEVGRDRREEIRGLMEESDGAVLIANYQVFSTGIDIKNLHNAILAIPKKSRVIVLQSIGRVLRKSPDGRAATVFDLVDDLEWDGDPNYALRHGRKRLSYYREEEFDVNVKTCTVG